MGEIYKRYVAGRPPTLIFVHGVLDRSSSFVKVGRELEGQALFFFDRRGYGRSLSAEVGPDPLTQNVEDLLSFSSQYGPALLVGHSLGALLSLMACLKECSYIQGVVAYEPPLSFRPWWFGVFQQASQDPSAPVEAVVDRFMERMIGQERYRALGESVRRRLHQEGPVMMAELTGARRLSPDFSRIKVPVVLAYGSESAERHKRAVTELASEIPQAFVKVLKGAGHRGHVTHSRGFAEIVRTALSYLVGSPPTGR